MFQFENVEFPLQGDGVCVSRVWHGARQCKNLAICWKLRVSDTTPIVSWVKMCSVRTISREDQKKETVMNKVSCNFCGNAKKYALEELTSRTHLGRKVLQCPICRTHLFIEEGGELRKTSMTTLESKDDTRSFE
ncbi:MAG: hypothetical protein A3D44_04140 [Candidatus Staskawiczbacteria bacterium RIFCSPHIGHO2_02_FULL_42_22]|uniref:Uncharacterized protein n=1 Tax=Candidatus Staskawiczbacteria bacterium RIFCSPHIGHO2_02_FULL_42_22 TaxID=1802207 RepID=A0A1G2I1H7_9BACT|nr:MAG: hypothetical protein A3D44_04140 [Candidatus Staskawiczbacteria bacterium RIFCSPHIGHO2_02_FULL_42_22]